MPRPRIGFVLALAMTLSATLVSVNVLAQTRGSTDAEARGLFDAATAAFDDGRFSDALGYFQRAHALSGRPEMLFNIAATCERLRRDREAIENYEAYLAAVPNARNRAYVESRLAILRPIVESTPPPRTDEVTGATPPPSPREVAESAQPSSPDTAPHDITDETPHAHVRRRRIILISVAAAVAAGVTVGLVAGLSGRGGTQVVAGDVGASGIVTALRAP